MFCKRALSRLSRFSQRSLLNRCPIQPCKFLPFVAFDCCHQSDTRLFSAKSADAKTGGRQRRIRRQPPAFPKGPQMEKATQKLEQLAFERRLKSVGKLEARELRYVLANTKSTQQIFDVVNSAPEADVALYNAAIKDVTNRGDYECAQRLMAQLLQKRRAIVKQLADDSVVAIDSNDKLLPKRRRNLERRIQKLTPDRATYSSYLKVFSLRLLDESNLWRHLSDDISEDTEHSNEADDSDNVGFDGLRHDDSDSDITESTAEFDLDTLLSKERRFLENTLNVSTVDSLVSAMLTDCIRNEMMLEFGNTPNFTVLNRVFATLSTLSHICADYLHRSEELQLLASEMRKLRRVQRRVLQQCQELLTAMHSQFGISPHSTTHLEVLKIFVDCRQQLGDATFLDDSAIDGTNEEMTAQMSDSAITDHCTDSGKAETDESLEAEESSRSGALERIREVLVKAHESLSKTYTVNGQMKAAARQYDFIKYIATCSKMICALPVASGNSDDDSGDCELGDALFEWMQSTVALMCEGLRIPMDSRGIMLSHFMECLLHRRDFAAVLSCFDALVDEEFKVPTADMPLGFNNSRDAADWSGSKTPPQLTAKKTFSNLTAATIRKTLDTVLQPPAADGDCTNVDAMQQFLCAVHILESCLRCDIVIESDILRGQYLDFIEYMYESWQCKEDTTTTVSYLYTVAKHLPSQLISLRCQKEANERLLYPKMLRRILRAEKCSVESAENEVDEGVEGDNSSDEEANECVSGREAAMFLLDVWCDSYYTNDLLWTNTGPLTAAKTEANGSTDISDTVVIDCAEDTATVVVDGGESEEVAAESVCELPETIYLNLAAWMQPRAVGSEEDVDLDLCALICFHALEKHGSAILAEARQKTIAAVFPNTGVSTGAFEHIVECLKDCYSDSLVVEAVHSESGLLTGLSVDLESFEECLNVIETENLKAEGHLDFLKEMGTEEYYLPQTEENKRLGSGKF